MDPTLYQSFEDDMQLHEDMARGGLRPIAHSQLPEFMSPGAPQTSNPDQLFEPSYQTVQSGPTAAPAHLHHASTEGPHQPTPDQNLQSPTPNGRRRGRPPGSKNRPKADERGSGSIPKNEPRGKGRPPGPKDGVSKFKSNPPNKAQVTRISSPAVIEASHPISEGYATAVPSVAEASHPIPDGYATASAPVVAPFLDPVEHYSHQQNASDEGFGGLRDEILGFLGRPNNPTITDQPTSTPAYPPLATGSNSHGPYFLHALPQEIANTTTNTATTTIAATASKEKSAKRKQDPITRPVEEPHRKGCPCRYCHSERPDDSPTPLSNAKDLIHALGQDTVDKFREMPAPQVQWNSIEERIRRIQRITREVDEKLNHVGIESPAEPKDQRTGSPDYSGPALPTDALYEERAQQTQMRHQALQEQESRLPTEFGMDQLIPGLLSDTVRTEFRMDQLIPGLLSETVPTEFEMDELLPELQSGTIPSEVENAELIPNLPSETTDNAGSIPGLTAETTETPIEFDQSLNAPSTQGGGRDQGDLEPSGEQPTFEDWMDWDWSGCPEWNPFAQDSFFVEGVPGGNEVEMTM